MKETKIDHIYNDDALSALSTMQDGSVDCIVTSPPYYGLRDYGIDGQIGLEETPQEYIDKLVKVFNECKRVLAGGGTLWINIGDSYWGSGSRGYDFTGKFTEASEVQSGSKGTINLSKIPKLVGNKNGYKNKDLIGIPWMLAFALRDDGWYLRQDIIWSKPNPMPESVKDRCVKSHEYIFLLSKKKNYWFDYKAIQEDSVCQVSFAQITDKRNKRDVWEVSTSQFKGAHFATYSKDLVKPMVLAGCPKNGVVLDPFFGSGTTGVVAIETGRHFVGIELNPEYVKIAQDRIKGTGYQASLYDMLEV